MLHFCVVASAARELRVSLRVCATWRKNERKLVMLELVVEHQSSRGLPRARVSMMTVTGGSALPALGPVLAVAELVPILRVDSAVAY